MSELVRAAMGGGGYASVPAASIVWTDRGRLCAVETATGLYHGYLGSVIFHKSGKIALSLFRGEVRGSVDVDPEHPVALHQEDRDPSVRHSDGSGS